MQYIFNMIDQLSTEQLKDYYLHLEKRNAHFDNSRLVLKNLTEYAKSVYQDKKDS